MKNIKLSTKQAGFKRCSYILLVKSGISVNKVHEFVEKIQIIKMSQMSIVVRESTENLERVLASLGFALIPILLTGLG